MPVEIRELVIKTEIVSSNRPNNTGNRSKDAALLKKQLLNECRRLLAEYMKRKDNKR